MVSNKLPIAFYFIKIAQVLRKYLAFKKKTESVNHPVQ